MLNKIRISKATAKPEADTAPVKRLAFIRNSQSNPMTLGRLVIRNGVYFDGRPIMFGMTSDRDIFNFIAQHQGAEVGLQEFMGVGLLRTDSHLRIRIASIRKAFGENSEIIPRHKTDKALIGGKYKLNMALVNPPAKFGVS